MKQVLVKINLIEQQDNSKPRMVSNIVIIPDKDGNYGFYYSQGKELIKLFIKGVEIIEVAELDDVQQLLLENKMSKEKKDFLRHQN